MYFIQCSSYREDIYTDPYRRLEHLVCIWEIQSASRRLPNNLRELAHNMYMYMAVSQYIVYLINLRMNQQGVIEVVIESHLINLVSHISQLLLSLHN